MINNRYLKKKTNSSDWVSIYIQLLSKKIIKIIKFLINRYILDKDLKFYILRNFLKINLLKNFDLLYAIHINMFLITLNRLSGIYMLNNIKYSVFVKKLNNYTENLYKLPSKESNMIKFYSNISLYKIYKDKQDKKWSIVDRGKKNTIWWVYIIEYLNKVMSYRGAPYLSHFFWFTTYLQLYFYKIIGYKINWHFNNFYTTIKNSNYSILWWRRFYKHKIFKSFFLSNPLNFFKLFINLLYFKNIDFLVNLVQKKITTVPLRYHKRYFYDVQYILKVLFDILQVEGYLAGFTIFFKGKLGRKGSVRKSKFFSKYGRVSRTNKALRVNYRQFLVYTETGVVGCYISLFY